MAAATTRTYGARTAEHLVFHGALSASQQRSVQKHARRETRRKNAQWFRKSLMKVATLGTGVENGMHVQSLQVDGHEEHDGITYFRIRVKGGGGQEWHVLHRYSDIDKLRKQLDVRDKRVGSIFPQKTFSSCEGQQIEQRQQVLQIWLDGLIAELSSGGDGHHKLLPLYRTSSLATLHSFCGANAIGRALPNITLAPAAVAGAVAEADGVFQPSAPQLSVVEAVASRQHRQHQQDAAPAAISDSMAGTEDEQLRAALEASTASHALEEESRCAREAEEVEAACRAEELLLRQQQERADAGRKGAEVLARRKAKAEEAERQVEEARRKAEEDASQKVHEEEFARLVAEEEDALRKAEEEAARSKAEEAEGLRRQAEEQANKTYLEQAMNMAGAGKELEDQGQTEDASDRYKKSIVLFTLAQRKEKAQKVRDAIQQKIEDLTTRSTQLSEAVMAAEAARVAEIMGELSQDASLLRRADALLASAPETEAARVAPLPALAPAASAAVAQ